jgi:hypothetical protein
LEIADKNCCYEGPKKGGSFRHATYIEKLIDNFFKLYTNSGKIPPMFEYKVSKYALVDIAIRVDKRKDYYKRYHQMRIDEFKFMFLYAYWVVKFSPITITDRRDTNESGEDISRFVGCINEAFAVFLLFSMAQTVYDIPEKIKIDPEDESTYIHRLFYALRYRNLSLDAMIHLSTAIHPDIFTKVFYDEN